MYSVVLSFQNVCLCVKAHKSGQSLGDCSQQVSLPVPLTRELVNPHHGLQHPVSEEKVILVDGQVERVNSQRLGQNLTVTAV